MTEIVFAIPIVRGKENLHRQTREELAGARRDEYAAALKDAGITRIAVWHQQIPDGGTLGIIYVEGSDPDVHSASLRLIRTSVGGSCSGRRSYMDGMSHGRLFRSSWFTTSASNG